MDIFATIAMLLVAAAGCLGALLRPDPVADRYVELCRRERESRQRR